MRTFFLFMMCLISLKAYTQEEEFNQLLSIKNVISTDLDFSKDDPSDPKNLESTESIFSKIEASSSKSSKFVTYNVYLNVLNGYTFHVADYSDGTRVITALDGSMRGYQAIGFNGVQVTGSSNVTWHSDYFVHKYPNGKVTSYATRQVAEF